VKRHWKTIVGVTVSGLLIWWVLRGVDPAEVWREMRGANGWLLLAAVAVATSGFLVRALRWKLLLHPIRPGTRLRTRFAAVNIGFAANNLLPARVGEFARAWSISRLEPVPMSGAVGSLVAERFLDGVAIFLLLLIALMSPGFPSGATVGGQPIGSVLAAIVFVLATILVGLLALLFFPDRFLRVTRSVVGVLPGQAGHLLVEVLESFIQGLGALRDLRLLAGALLWSVGFWAWNGVSFWLGMLAFGIEGGYAAALFVQAIVAIGVSIPAAPGFFGTFHAATVVALHEVYGAGEGATLAFAFGYHLGGFIPVTLMGLWYAGRLGLTLAQLGQADRVVESELDRELHP